MNEKAGTPRSAPPNALGPDKAQSNDVEGARTVGGVRRAISRVEAARWAEENAAFVQSCNAYIEKHGLPLQKYRVR